MTRVHCWGGVNPAQGGSRQTGRHGVGWGRPRTVIACPLWPVRGQRGVGYQQPSPEFTGNSDFAGPRKGSTAGVAVCPGSGNEREEERKRQREIFQPVVHCPYALINQG